VRHAPLAGRAEPAGSDIARAPARGADLACRSRARPPAPTAATPKPKHSLPVVPCTIDGARIWCGQGMFAHSLMKPSGPLKVKQSKPALRDWST
jgi:hypothetical protein